MSNTKVGFSGTYRASYEAALAKLGYERFVASLEEVIAMPDETLSSTVWPGWNELGAQTRVAWMAATRAILRASYQANIDALTDNEQP